MTEEFFHGYTPVASGNHACLERHRLNSLLEKAAQKPIVLVAAGPGYGKTRAVYAFVKKARVRTAWIQLSEHDNSPGHFWDNFLSTVPVVSGDRAEKLRKLGFPGTEEDVAAYLKVSQGEALPNEKYLFVFDDLHLVTEKTVLYFIERRVTALFPNVTYVLISRKEPAFNLEKQASKELIARITGDDLSFTRDEMVAWFRLQNLTPGPEMTSAIYRYTEGWAFAIRLAGLSLGNNSPCAAYVPQALRSNTRKLIEGEIMAPLSPELRRFLIKLSLVENLNPGLLEKIAGGSSLVKEMENIGSFIRFDCCLNSYRIHYLFMDYLRELQDELSGEEKKEVWALSALWCAENGRKTEAISNYEKTGDYNAIANILDTLPMVLPIPTAAFVLEFLERLSETVFRDFPRFISIRIRALVSLGRYEQGRAELLKILPALAALPESREKHLALTACNLHMGFIGFILSARTKCYDFIHSFKTASDESRISGYGQSVKPPLNGINIGSRVCRVTDPSPGELEKFIAAVGEMVPYSAEAMGGCQYGMYELARGEYAFYRARLDEAEKSLIEAVRMGREKDQFEIENRALFYLLRIYISRGNAGGVETVLKKLKDTLEETLYPNRHSHYDIIMGWYYTQTGRKEPIAPWLKSDYAESGLNSRSHGFEKIVKAKYYFSEKRYPAALAFLENRENLEIFVMGLIEMKSLEAVCRFKLLDREGAYLVLEEARALAAPSGLFMPFTELGKDMRSLAEAAARDRAPGLSPEWLEEIRRGAAVYAKKLYRLSGRGGAERASLLSHREMNVLTGLSRGLTREEIAGAASISPNTVKSVTRSIYNKLGALNHADAVRIATARGLLS